MYSRILVGVALHDGETADKPGQTGEAIKLANLLRGEKGVVTLLHVVENIPGYVASQLPSGIIEKSRDDAKHALREIAENAASDLQTVVVYGHSGRTIIDYAESHNVDCIIIASHRPELKDYVFGTTAAHVARHAPCAVHVLR